MLLANSFNISCHHVHRIATTLSTGREPEQLPETAVGVSPEYFRHQVLTHSYEFSEGIDW
jgi:hypothetical protein